MRKILKDINYRFVKFFVSLRKLLEEETETTKEMLNIYSKSFVGEATKEDIKKANNDLVELFKKLGVGSILVFVPFSLFLFPLVVKFARWYGVEILPADYRDRFKEVVVKDENIKP